MPMPDRITDEAVSNPWEGDEDRVSDVAAWLELKLANGDTSSSAVSEAWEVLQDAFGNHNEQMLKLFYSDREDGMEYGRSVAVELLYAYVEQNIGVLARAKEQG